jgi:DNA polymerase-3 subunit delta'
MSFERILGQGEAVGRLKRALESGTLAQALLFAGPDGVGKRAAAVEVARALLCGEGGCGRCPSCRHVAAGTHPDLFIVEAASESTGVNIEQVRRLAERISESPLEGSQKAAIIDGADSMKPPAQNALLKTLEEPPADTTIILVAANPGMLLPTIRSRCRRVDFAPVGASVIADFLVERGAARETADVTARLAGGSFAAALALLDGGAGEEREQILRLVFAGDGGEEAREEISAMLVGGGQMRLREKRARAIGILAAVHSAVVDALRISGGAAAGTNVDFVDEIAGFAGRLGFQRLAVLEKEVHDGIIALSMNADVRLVADRLTPAFLAAAAADQG